MISDPLTELPKKATEANLSNEFADAGKYYKLCAFAYFSHGEWVHFEEVGKGVNFLHSATLAFRIGGHMEQARNHANLGLTISEDVRTSLAKTKVEKGITYEYDGDFHLFGGLADYDEYYERARELYREYEENTNINERIGQMSEESIHMNTQLLRDLFSVTGFEIEEETQTKIEFQSPVARIDFKVEELPKIVDRFLEQGKWLSKLDK